jgi:hypothetical protein
MKPETMKRVFKLQACSRWTRSLYRSASKTAPRDKIATQNSEKAAAAIYCRS